MEINAAEPGDLRVDVRMDATMHNNQRDGIHRQAIPRGRVSYEPNSLGGGCPFQAGVKGFVSFPPAIETQNEPVDKVRGKPEKFAEHYSQARLFFDSQSADEQAHIVGGLRFELSKVTVPAIRERMVSSLRNVSDTLAQQVAHGLGMELPAAMPRAIKQAPKPEIATSSALSLLALPGNGGVATRKVAVIIADGVASAPVTALVGTLTDAGAVVRLLSSRLGKVRSHEGATLEVDATLENSPSVLFDALILPDGSTATATLAKDGHTVEFLKDQYRHCKTILVLGSSSELLGLAGIAESLPGGAKDPGLLIAADAGTAVVKAFVAAMTRHRHPERDRDPPSV